MAEERWKKYLALAGLSPPTEPLLGPHPKSPLPHGKPVKEEAVEAQLNWYEKIIRYAPPIIVGSFYQKQWSAAGEAAEEWEAETGRELTQEDLQDPDIKTRLVIRAQDIAREGMREQPLGEVFAGIPAKEKYLEYRELPWYKQLMWEAPFWAATGLVSVAVGGATGISASLAAKVVAGGAKGKAAKALIQLLRPQVKYEQVLGNLIAKIRLPVFNRGFQKYPAWVEAQKVFPEVSAARSLIEQQLRQAYMAERAGNYALAQQIRMNVWRNYQPQFSGEPAVQVFNTLKTTTLPVLSPKQPFYPVTNQMWSMMEKSQREAILKFLALSPEFASQTWVVLGAGTKSVLSGGEVEVPRIVTPDIERIEKLIGRDLEVGEYEAIQRELPAYGGSLEETLIALGYFPEAGIEALPAEPPRAGIGFAPTAPMPFEPQTGVEAQMAYAIVEDELQGFKAFLEGVTLSAGDTTLAEARMGAMEGELTRLEGELERFGVEKLAIAPEIAPEAVRPPGEVVKPVVSKVAPPAEVKLPNLLVELGRQYADIKTEIAATRASLKGLKGLKGSEAKLANISLNELERSLKNASAVLKEYKKIQDLPDKQRLRQTISIIGKYKGFTKKQLSEIYHKATAIPRVKAGEPKLVGKRKLSNMTLPELQGVLNAIRKARPTRIKGKVVITAKTEQAIQSLKNQLIKEGKLTKEYYRQIMSEMKLSTDKYVNGMWFTTEPQGKELIKNMNFVAILRFRRFEAKIQAELEKNPELAKVITGFEELIKREAPPEVIKRAHISAKLAVEWYEEKQAIGLSSVMSFLPALRRFQEQLGGRVTTRIYDVAVEAVEQRRLNDLILLNLGQKLLAEVPEIKRLCETKESALRIQQALDSELVVTDAPAYPEDITPGEEAVLNALRKGYDSWKNTVRFERFKAAYHTYDGDATKIKQGDDPIAIPDAPLADVKKAVEIYESKGDTGLRVYLDTKTWGVIESGYSPIKAQRPRIRVEELRAVRIGKGKLEQRHGIIFEKDVQANPYQNYMAYLRSVVSLNLQPYFYAMDKEFAKVIPRLKDANRDKDFINLFLKEVKGAVRPGVVAGSLLRMGGWSFGTIALQPRLFVRNLFQNAAFHPDKEEFLRVAFNFLTPSQRAELYFHKVSEDSVGRKEHFDWLVTQSQAVKMEQMLLGYMGRSPFERWLRYASYYFYSDKINRAASMTASAGKAERALEQYKKDGNVGKFAKSSGMLELSHTDKIRVLELLALKRYEYPEGTLGSVSGSEQAVREIASLITTSVHFNYIRYLRAHIEMGAMGRVVGSLAAFARGMTERYGLLFGRLIRTFGKGPPMKEPPKGWDVPPGQEEPPLKWLPGAMRRRYIKALAQMIIGSYIAGGIYAKLLNKQNPYHPFTVWQWQIGGLAFGAMLELQEMWRFIAMGAVSDDEGTKKYAAQQLAIITPRLGGMFIPWYINTIATIESLIGEKYIDRKFLREILVLLKLQQTINEKFYEQERTSWQKVMHAVFNTKVPDPTPIEKALKNTELAIASLGKLDAEVGTVSDTGKLSSLYRKEFKNGQYWRVEPDLITEEEGFTPLARFWVETDWLISYFNELSEADKKLELHANPWLHAYLYFWEQRWANIPEDIQPLVEELVKEYGIPRNAVRALQEVSVPAIKPEVPPPAEAPEEPLTRTEKYLEEAGLR